MQSLRGGSQRALENKDESHIAHTNVQQNLSLVPPLEGKIAAFASQKRNRCLLASLVFKSRMGVTRTLFCLAQSCLFFVAAFTTPLFAQSQSPASLTRNGLQLLNPDVRQWRRAEFRLDSVPLGGANPYDPDQIALDAIIVSSDGMRSNVPLFWYVGYSRSRLNMAYGDVEALTPDPQMSGEWRLRWTPRASGLYRIGVTVRRQGKSQTLPPFSCKVAPHSASAHGFMSLEPKQKRFFCTDDGKSLPLLGMNACWPGKRGTFDYDDWLPAMGRNSMNYTRLWQGNAGFRAELYGDERLHYNQATLWQLDRVFDVAAQNDINIMLCMGFHGEFQTERDDWGGTGFWTSHAYNAKNGGPCEKPNDFFTDSTAATLYQKRLRYLVARYGANTNLLSWQFFNEVNNIYGDANASQNETRERNRLYPPDVVAWHERMGKYLRALDPYHHLVTTSLGSAGEQKKLWQLPQLDYANWHWYGNWGGPYSTVTQMTEAVGTQFGPRYGKPVVIAEFGTDGHGWAPQNDLERRGLRQALWGSIFCGAAGTAMPWWWEDIHKENLYPLWKSLHDFLPADFGSAAWKTVETHRPVTPPAKLGAVAPDAERFSQRISLTNSWGKGSGEPVVLNRVGDGDDGKASGFIHGRSKPDLITPFVIQANVGEGAQLVMHLNSVANDPVLLVRQNGKEIFRRDLPNKDGQWVRNDEYNEDIAVPLQAGRASIEISNGGEDWFLLDWVRVDGVLQSQGGEPPLALEQYLLSDGKTRLLWLVDNRYSWPRNRAQEAPTVEEAKITLKGWPVGRWNVEWWDTRSGKSLGKAQVKAQGGELELPIPTFRGDVAARLTSVG